MKISKPALERMNIGRRYWNADVRELSEGAVKSCFRAYLKDLKVNAEGGWGLYMYGANGVGKTYACTSLLKEVVLAGYSAYCILADELKLAYIDGSRFDADSTIVRRVETVDFLLIEDLGKEYSGRGSGFAELCFENLLRKRSRECRPTLVTSNLSPVDFKSRYQESAASLAMECMIAVQMKGSDRRRDMAQKKKLEYV